MYFVRALLTFVFSSKRLFFIGTGGSIIMIHTFKQGVFVWFDFLRGNFLSTSPQNSCMMYVHTHVCGQTSKHILQSHPDSG